MTMTQDGALVLADISGFTAFVSATELEHGPPIIAELLEEIMRTPVLDDRPNWWPIRRRLPCDAADSEDRDDPLDGLPEPAAEPVVVRQRRPVASTRPATSPSGV